jgi:16S rRNA pseudouridine516 synthase
MQGLRPERLDAWLSRLGYASRREARQWLRLGRVCVEGVVATDPGMRTVPGSVTVDGQPLEAPEGLLIRMHKPAGRVCSHVLEEGPNVYGLVPERWRRRHPPLTTVGRLDRDTTGVLLLTDDGDWVQRWTSPRSDVVKVYEATVDGGLASDAVERFASGTLMLTGESKPCRPATLRVLEDGRVQLELTEGRHHQVKRMLAAVGCGVVTLHRVRFGDYTADGLAPGEWERIPFPTTRAGR